MAALTSQGVGVLHNIPILTQWSCKMPPWSQVPDEPADPVVGRDPAHPVVLDKFAPKNFVEEIFHRLQTKTAAELIIYADARRQMDQLKIINRH